MRSASCRRALPTLGPHAGEHDVRRSYPNLEVLRAREALVEPPAQPDAAARFGRGVVLGFGHGVRGERFEGKI